MKDVRITISGRDFAAVSKSMVDLGVAFQVEPVETVEGEVVSSAPAVPRRRQSKRKATRTRRSTSAPERTAARESPGAARLRAMAERNRAAAAGSGGDAQAGTSGGVLGTDTEQSGETD